MKLVSLFFLLSLSCSISFSSDFEEIDLNTMIHEQTQFLNYPSVKEEFDKILSIGGDRPRFQFKYFVSYRNILPPGLSASQYIANEHVAIFKSRVSDTFCSVRANIVWRKDDGLNTLDEDYSEPSRIYSCYKF